MNLPKRVQLELVVSRKEKITPHYYKIFLKGEGIGQLKNATVGDNNKVLFPPAGVSKIYFPEFDPVAKKWKPQPPELKPVIRTLTHKGIDLKRGELEIDFITHEGFGVSSSWAETAQKGDILGVMMKTSQEELIPEVDQYFLAGDATAIPVLGAILEQLPAKAKGHCLLEVDSSSDEQALETKSGIILRWIHNPEPQKGSRLAAFFREFRLPEKDRFAYIAGEYETVREIRNYLRKERAWSKGEFYAYSYWKAGLQEDQSQADRRAERDRDFS